MLLRPHLLASVCIAFGPLLLAGCKTTEQPPPPDVDLPDKFTTGSVKPMEYSPNSIAWWEEFKDPQLSALIARGLDENISLKMARERLDIARIRHAVSGTGYLPQARVSAGARASGEIENGVSGTNAVASSGAQFSWLIDIFGRTASQIADAKATEEAAAADLETVRLAYLTDIASSYIELQFYRRALGLARGNVTSFETTLKLTEEMREAGTATNLDTAQARALVDGAKAEIPPLEVAREKALNHIAVLLGTTSRDVDGLVPRSDRQPRLASTPTIGIPADLLRHRPDIRREEHKLTAAAAKIGIAEADLYPSLTLNGNIDIARLLVSGLSAATMAWSFGPSIVSPLLDGGKARAGVDIAKVESRVQYLDWKNTVLKAVEEVENAVVALHRGKTETTALQRKVQSYETAAGLATEAYSGGTGVILDVLEANRELAKARLALADSQRRNAVDGIRLYVALGGGSVVGGPSGGM